MFMWLMPVSRLSLRATRDFSMSVCTLIYVEGSCRNLGQACQKARENFILGNALRLNIFCKVQQQPERSFDMTTCQKWIFMKESSVGMPMTDLCRGHKPGSHATAASAVCW